MKRPRWLESKRNRLTAIVSICIVLVIILLSTHSKHSKNSTAIAPTNTQANTKVVLKTPHPQQAQQNIASETKAVFKQFKESAAGWQPYRVKKGDSLASILKRNKLSPQSIYRISQLNAVDKMIKNLHPGQTIKIKKNKQQQLISLKYTLNPQHTLIINQHLPGPTFSSKMISIPLKTSTAFAAGSIDSSLTAAMQQAGVNQRLSSQLQKIFDWKVDFKRDIHPHDAFAMLYKKQTAARKVVSTGPIAIVGLLTRKKINLAILFEDKQHRPAFYNLKGSNWQSQFLRKPIPHARISSSFSLRRFNPVLKIWRPHWGVDLAAPTGTPVQASAYGVITSIRRHQGYGNVIYIRHNQTYSTRYAHLEKFAKGLHLRSRVHKGQVIGYVGTTGISTGPHLHYEVRVNGIAKDPMKVKLPQAASISRKNRAAFQKLAISELEDLITHLQKTRESQKAYFSDHAYQRLKLTLSESLQEKIAQQKATRKKMALQKAAQEKLARQKAAQEKLALQKTAQQKLARQKAAQHKRDMIIVAHHKAAPQQATIKSQQHKIKSQQRNMQKKIA